MPKLLEVIVTSLEEAREAELGGADRLELVRAFELGGLTPLPGLVEQVVAEVSIPVRVMLRENASMSTTDPHEIRQLQALARELSRLPIDGLVLGFVKDGGLDLETMHRVLAAGPDCRVTLHRAFEHVADPITAIQQVKSLPQIDRILTSGGKARLLELQAAAAPSIQILVGVGLCESILTEMSRYPGFEFHVGRAARAPQTTSGLVSSAQVGRLKALL